VGAKKAATTAELNSEFRLVSETLAEALRESARIIKNATWPAPQSLRQELNALAVRLRAIERLTVWEDQLVLAAGAREEKPQVGDQQFSHAHKAAATACGNLLFVAWFDSNFDSLNATNVDVKALDPFELAALFTKADPLAKLAADNADDDTVNRFFAKTAEWRVVFRDLQFDTDGLIFQLERERAIVAEHRSDRVGDAMTKSDQRESWVIKALMLRKANPNMTKTEIAKRVGVHAGQLSPRRFPELASLEKFLANNVPLGHLLTDSDSNRRALEAVDTSDSEFTDRGDPIPGSKYFLEYCESCNAKMRVPRAQVGTRPHCDDCAK